MVCPPEIKSAQASPEISQMSIKTWWSVYMKGGVSESAQQTCVERERERDTSKIIFIGINIQIQKYLTVRCHIYSKSIKTDKKEKKPITKDFK